MKEYPGTRCETLKKKAAGIIGQDEVDKVFPPPQMKIIFEKTYTTSDADKNNFIYTIKWDSRFKPGDRVIITGHHPDRQQLTDDFIYYYRGKIFNPKWVASQNGIISYKIDYVAVNNSLVIWIDKGKNFYANVKVVREVHQNPRIDLLAK